MIQQSYQRFYINHTPFKASLRLVYHGLSPVVFKAMGASMLVLCMSDILIDQVVYLLLNPLV